MADESYNGEWKESTLCRKYTTLYRNGTGQHWITRRAGGPVYGRGGGIAR